MHLLSKRVNGCIFTNIRYENIFNYGDEKDGVIELPAITKDGGIVEVGYFFGEEKPKNIIDISSQIGCPGKCIFCEAGADSFSRNLTPVEMHEQVMVMLQAALMQGQLQMVEQFFDERVIIPDLREGDLSLSELWFDWQVQRLSALEKVPVDDELRARVQREFPVPAAFDFSMVVDD